MSELSAVQQKHVALQKYLEQPRVQQELAKVLPQHMNAQRLARVALTAAIKQPLILQCTPVSVASALLNCSEMGLEPNGRDCHLIPFKNKGQYELQVIPDYKGLIKLAYNSGMVTEIEAQAVRKNDHFEYQFGTGGYIRFRPGEGERGELAYAWARAALSGKGEVFVVLDRKKVMAHKAKSRASNSDFSPWNDPEFEEAMWAKTAVRELSKFIPQSPQMSTAFQLDDEADYGKSQVVPVFPATTIDLAAAPDMNSPGNVCADDPFEVFDDKSGRLAKEAAGK